MTFPPDGTMLVLTAVYVGGDVTPDGTEMFLDKAVPGERLWVPDEAMTDLEARGWLEIGESGPVVTESGGYWLAKWFRARGRKWEARWAPRLRAVHSRQGGGA